MVFVTVSERYRDSFPSQCEPVLRFLYISDLSRTFVNYNFKYSRTTMYHTPMTQLCY